MHPEYKEEIIKRVKDFLTLITAPTITDGQNESESVPELGNKAENELVGASARIEFPQCIHCITPECGHEIRTTSLPFVNESVADSESKLQCCSLPELLNVQVRKTLQSDRRIAMAIPSMEGPSNDCIPKVLVQSEVDPNVLNHKDSGDTYIKGTGARPKIPLKPENERNEHKYPHVSKNVSNLISTSCQTDLSFSFDEPGIRNNHHDYLSNNNNESEHISEVADPTILPFQSYQSSNGSDLDIYTTKVKGQNCTAEVKAQSPQPLNESENQSDRSNVNNLIIEGNGSTTNEALNEVKGRPILGKKYDIEAINANESGDPENATAKFHARSEPESSIRSRDDKAANVVGELHEVNKNDNSKELGGQEIFGKARESSERKQTTEMNHQVNDTSQMKTAGNTDQSTPSNGSTMEGAVGGIDHPETPRSKRKETEHQNNFELQRQISLSSAPAAKGNSGSTDHSKPPAVAEDNFSSLEGAVGGIVHRETPRSEMREANHQNTKDEKGQVRKSSPEKNGISKQKENHAHQKIANKKKIDNAVTADMKQKTSKIGEETNTDVHAANDEETRLQRGDRAINNNNGAKHAKSRRSNNAEIEKLKSIRSENQRLKDAKTCRICRDRDANRMFLPCAHLVACSLCSPAVTHCPQCRGKSKGVISVYFG